MVKMCDVRSIIQVFSTFLVSYVESRWYVTFVLYVNSSDPYRERERESVRERQRERERE